jgi:hypothetical protein
MRDTAAVLFVVGSLLAAPASTSADDAAKAILQQAIKAHGGAELLAKTALMTRRAKGTMSFAGQEVPFTDELVLQLPLRWRWTLDAGDAGQKTRLLFIVNGDKGWQTTTGVVTDITKERLVELHEEAYVIWLSTLLPFVKDTGFSLASLADAAVEGRPAASIQVAHKGHPDANLYFDKQSGLLVKIARRAKVAGLAVDKEYLYSAHRPFEGIQLPTRYAELANGKKLVDVADISYSFLRSVDDNTFGRP